MKKIISVLVIGFVIMIFQSCSNNQDIGRFTISSDGQYLLDTKTGKMWMIEWELQTGKTRKLYPINNNDLSK